jgi:hypothetical protein
MAKRLGITMNALSVHVSRIVLPLKRCRQFAVSKIHRTERDGLTSGTRPASTRGSAEVGILRNRGAYGGLHQRQEPAQHPCALTRFESRRQ